MTRTSAPFHFCTLRHRALAVQLSAVLLAGAAADTPATAQATPEPAWPGLRADPARRLFPSLPAVRTTTAGGVRAPAAAVTNCADDGPGSLRAAVAAANDGDTIDLAALRCGTITLATGAIAVDLDSLTLEGPGRYELGIDGHASDRVFFHPGGGTLTLHGLTIENGHDRATGFDVAGGGCIASAGYVVLDQTTVRNCYAGGEGAYGGAIYAYSLTLADSTMSGNEAYGIHPDAGTAAFGGAAFVYTMQLSGSTVTGNRAVHHFNEGRTSYDIGGGIITVQGGSVYASTVDTNYSYGRGGGIAAFNTISVLDSTLSGNVAKTEIGGALFLRRNASLDLFNSTLTANEAAAGGGGIWIGVDDATIQSSIVFGNTGGAGHARDIEDPVALAINGANNLIGDAAATVSVPPDTLDIDPELGPLAENGGPTRTHAFRGTSVVVDAGNNAGSFASDQRGTLYPRSYGAAPDIGAFERQGTPPPVPHVPVPASQAWGLGLLAFALALLSRRGLATTRRRHGSVGAHCRSPQVELFP